MGSVSIFPRCRLRDLLGIDLDVIQDYIHFAEMAKVLFEVPHFAYSLQAQKRPNRKISLIDNDLAERGILPLL